MASPNADRERQKRDRQPTLRDFDPLRHDLEYRREHDPTRDSMPTLPEIDPLRFDQQD